LLKSRLLARVPRFLRQTSVPACSLRPKSAGEGREPLERGSSYCSGIDGSMVKISFLDYGAGNIRSLRNALTKVMSFYPPSPSPLHISLESLRLVLGNVPRAPLPCEAGCTRWLRSRGAPWILDSALDPSQPLQRRGLLADMCTCGEWAGWVRDRGCQVRGRHRQCPHSHLPR